MLAQGLYRRGESGDLERAKDQLSFCFKSARSSFTINMWEIDSMTKKGRRKIPGSTGNKKALEVNLPESSRNSLLAFESICYFISNYWRRQDMDVFLSVHMFPSGEISGFHYALKILYQWLSENI